MTRLGRIPEHCYHGRPTSVAGLAQLAGVGRTTMVRRLLILTPEEAVALGPVGDLAARRAAAEVVPRRHYLYFDQRLTIAALAALAACTRSAMRARLDAGLSPEDAVAAGPNMRPSYFWKGKPVTVAALADLAGCSTNAMALRLNRHGRTPEEAVAQGAEAERSDLPRYQWQGHQLTSSELARIAGCSADTMGRRLARGRTPGEAVALGSAARSGRSPEK